MTKEFNRENALAETVVSLASAPKAARQKLIEDYQRRSEAAYAPSTLRNYRQILASFKTWCDGSGHSWQPPVPPETIALYVEALGGKIRPTTIETRLWAIAELHRATFQPNPCRHRLVSLALKAVKRTYGAFVRQAPPLCKEEVLTVIDGLGDSRQELRDKALLWTATDSWCRASELVALRVCDLVRQDNGSSLLFIAKSKTDPYGEGDFAFLSKNGTEAVLKWIELAGTREKDPIFTKSQPNARIQQMDPATVSRIIKRRTGRSDVSAHSMRVGGVHDAFRIGCDLSSIMVAGRWKSPEMPARYGRRILASDSAAARVSAAYSEELK